MREKKKRKEKKRREKIGKKTHESLKGKRGEECLPSNLHQVREEDNSLARSDFALRERGRRGILLPL